MDLLFLFHKDIINFIKSIQRHFILKFVMNFVYCYFKGGATI